MAKLTIQCPCCTTDFSVEPPPGSDTEATRIAHCPECGEACWVGGEPENDEEDE